MAGDPGPAGGGGPALGRVREEDGVRGHRQAPGAGGREPASRGCPAVTLRSCLGNGRQDPGLSVEVGMGGGRRFGEGREIGRAHV